MRFCYYFLLYQVGNQAKSDTLYFGQKSWARADDDELHARRGMGRVVTHGPWGRAGMLSKPAEDFKKTPPHAPRTAPRCRDVAFGNLLLLPV